MYYMCLMGGFIDVYYFWNIWEVLGSWSFVFYNCEVVYWFVVGIIKECVIGEVY